MVKHFIVFSDFSKDEVRLVLDNAHYLKKQWRKSKSHSVSIRGKTLAMLFESNSTRTRVSFEVAMRHLEGNAIFLSSQDSQSARGELDRDSARVLSGMCDLIMIRTVDHQRLEQFRQYSSVPTINGLSNISHPCQVLSDLMTIEEILGDYQHKTVSWFGAANNMLFTLIDAAQLLDIRLKIACPNSILEKNSIPIPVSDTITIHQDPMEAVSDADIVMTDVWLSMHDKPEESREIKELLSPYQVTMKVMGQAKPTAIFLHCLPAKRGEEVTDEVLESNRSKVWIQAENRLHCQKSIICHLLD